MLKTHRVEREPWGEDQRANAAGDRREFDPPAPFGSVHTQGDRNNQQREQRQRLRAAQDCARNRRAHPQRGSRSRRVPETEHRNQSKDGPKLRHARHTMPPER